MEKARVAKAEEKRLISEERRAQSRLADLQRKLEEVEAGLAIEASSRAAASLPCPVCRASIDRRFLPELGGASGSSSPCRAESTSAASVEGLPAELRKKVRDLQARHRLLWDQQQENQAIEPSTDVGTTATEAQHTTEVVVLAPQDPAPAQRHGPGGSASKGYSISSSLAQGHNTSPQAAVHNGTVTVAPSQDSDWSWNAADGGQWHGGWNSSRNGPDTEWWSSKGGKAQGSRGGRWKK